MFRVLQRIVSKWQNVFRSMKCAFSRIQLFCIQRLWFRKRSYTCHTITLQNMIFFFFFDVDVVDCLLSVFHGPLGNIIEQQYTKSNKMELNWFFFFFLNIHGSTWFYFIIGWPWGLSDQYLTVTHFDACNCIDHFYSVSNFEFSIWKICFWRCRV